MPKGPRYYVYTDLTIHNTAADEIKVGQTNTEANLIGRYEFKTPSKTVFEAWYYEE